MTVSMKRVVLASHARGIPWPSDFCVEGIDAAAQTFSSALTGNSFVGKLPVMVAQDAR